MHVNVVNDSASCTMGRVHTRPGSTRVHKHALHPQFMCLHAPLKRGGKKCARVNVTHLRPARSYRHQQNAALCIGLCTEIRFLHSTDRKVTVLIGIGIETCPVFRFHVSVPLVGCVMLVFFWLRDNAACDWLKRKPCVCACRHFSQSEVCMHLEG